jgi:hypothetical protein
VQLAKIILKPIAKDRHKEAKQAVVAAYLEVLLLK